MEGGKRDEGRDKLNVEVGRIDGKKS